MTPEVRRAALRMAAKTAFVASQIIAVAGCSSGQAVKPAPANTAPTVPVANAAPPVDCPTHLAGLATVKKDELAADDPLRQRNDVYGEVFADITARQSARTQQCCTEHLDKDNAQAKQRWECCSALPEGAQAMACTPWGPPCPPEMLG